MMLIETAFTRPESQAMQAFIDPATKVHELFVPTMGALVISRVEDNWSQPEHSGTIQGLVDFNGSALDLQAYVTFPGKVKTRIAELLHREPKATIYLTLSKPQADELYYN